MAALEESNTLLQTQARQLEHQTQEARELAHELVSGEGTAVPGRAGLERLRERALAVLRAFAAPAPPAAPAPGQQPRDPGFWRR